MSSESPAPESTAKEPYKVQLKVFEGPLDLLLYLIRKEEIDIQDIPIERITRQYLEYLNMMQQMDLNVAGEFVVMAATLMYIKSRMLLPPDQQEPLEEVPEDPRLDLVRQLVEYKKFKEAAEELGQREQAASRLFARVATPDVLAGERQLDVSVFDLLTAFNSVLKRLEGEGMREVYEDTFTVAEKILKIRELLKAEKSVQFADLFKDAASKPELVATFLAILELMKLNEIRGFQSEPFGPIRLETRR